MILGIVLLTACSSAKLSQLGTQGNLSQESFNQEFNFEYENGHIYIEVLLKGESHTFLFDTGFDITTLDQSLFSAIDFVPFKKYQTGGTSFEDHKVLYGFLGSLSINNLEFTNIGVGFQDLSYIKNPFPNGRKISGIIGTNIMRKAYWQIDYKKKKIKLSHQLENFKALENSLVCQMHPRTKSGWGNCLISINFDGVEGDFVFDTGSSGAFTGNGELEEKLKNKLKLKKSDQNLMSLEKAEFGDIRILNVSLKIEDMKRSLLGNDFFENYIITMDWTENKLYLLPN